MRTLHLLLIAALLASIPACSEAQKESMAAQAEARRRTMSQKMLEERAQEFWEAVRWQNWTAAAPFLEEPDDQRSYLRSKTDPDARHASMDAIEVKYVFVTGADFNQGEVRIQWNKVDTATGQVGPEEATQSWYKEHGRWWLDPEETLLESRSAATPTASSERGLDESPLQQR